MYDKKDLRSVDEIARQLSDDLLAFLKTVHLRDIDSPAGYADFRHELDERAAIRTAGKISKLFLQTMVVQ